jgi:peptidoglycan hydrolase CwlO-like protein
MYSDVVDERQGVEEKRDEVIRTISSLEASIATLDNDISKVMQKLKDMNTKIINIKNDIEVNIKTIDNLKEKVTENTEILLEYLIYIYKKSNTAYS